MPDTQARFEPPGGTFLTQQMVRLVAGAPDAVIRYTIDGTLPTPASPAYAAPIAVRETTIIRALAISPTRGMGAVQAAIFVRVADDSATFSSNLPIVVLHTHASGVLPAIPDSPYLAGSVIALEPAANGRTALVGTGALTSRAGLRVRGNSSTRFPQKSYGVELRHGFDDTDDDRPFVGLPSESDWALVAPSQVDRTLIRNALAFALSNQIGRYAPRVRMVEVFTIEKGAAAPLTRADYKGVYAAVEKIKRSNSRLALAKLEATSLAEPAISGGYIFRLDHGEKEIPVRTVPGHTIIPGQGFQFVDPDLAELMPAARMPQRTYLTRYLQEFFDALGAANFRHPTNGKPYTDYIDTGSFIDHNLLNAVFMNVDGLRLSAYLHKDRGKPITAGPIWDFDRSSGTPWDNDYGNRASNPRIWGHPEGTHYLTWGYYGRLFADPTFKTAHARRWAELATGPLSVANMTQLIDKLVAELTEAQARHFARWTEMPPSGGSHAAEVKLLKDFLAARVQWMSSQLVP